MQLVLGPKATTVMTMAERMTMETWETIPEFPDYLVSDRGLICNERTGRILAQQTNQYGVRYVGLVKDKEQFKRSVAKLVAEAFIPNHNPRFNTPMHLDANQDHNFVANLVWRPRPFVITYYRQFHHPYKHRIEVPIEIIQTGERFESSWDAARAYGLLERAVVMSVLNESTPVFPTSQLFRLIQE